jgi:hypothetical protein
MNFIQIPPHYAAETFLALLHYRRLTKYPLFEVHGLSCAVLTKTRFVFVNPLGVQ